MALRLARHWWAVAVRAGVALLFGTAALVWVGIPLPALAFLFGAYAFADGLLAELLALAGRRPAGRWAALHLQGLIGLAAGVTALARPDLGPLAVLYIIAAWAMLSGLLACVT